MTLYTKRGRRYVPATLSEQGAWGDNGLMAMAATWWFRQPATVGKIR